MTVPPPLPPPIPPPRPTPESPSGTARIIGLIVGAGLLAAALVVVGVLSTVRSHAARANPTPAAGVETESAAVEPPPPDVAPPAVIDDAPASPPLSATVAEFGDVWTWADGISVSVVSATPFEVSDSATGVQSGQLGVVVTVTVTNGSTGVIDLALCQVDLRAGDLGVIATQIHDPDNVGEQLGGILAPGQVATGEFAFGVDPVNAGKVDIAVTPTWDYETALFSGLTG